MGNKICVIGAGLCGSLLAVRLAQRGHTVDLFEKRGDMRLQEFEGGRSINLALSDRGLGALRLAGLEDSARKLCTPMEGRMIHFKDGAKRFSRYSGREQDYINSISREDLNILLLNEAEKTGLVNIHFNHPCSVVNIQDGEINFLSQNHIDTDDYVAVIGTDGAGSTLRRTFMRNTTKYLFNYSQHFLKSGYKEITIPPGPNGSYLIENNALHIWPRESFMIIALPNLDGSFTVTLFWPFNGENGFNEVNSWQKLEAFFKEEFQDLLPLLPDLEEEYFSNPTGTLGTIKCDPWTVEDKYLIMGDAAHAIVPFYGQGMNASFEDVLVFDKILDELDDDWPKVLSTFATQRKPDTDAIADLALDNFYEMQDHVADANFIEKRKLEMRLEQEIKDYYSKYSLVTFKETMGYRDAMIKGRAQDKFLLELVNSKRHETMSLQEIYEETIKL